MIVRLRNNTTNSVTNSFLNIQSEAPSESFISLKSAHLLRKVTTGEEVHLSTADVSQLWMESQITVDKRRKSVLSQASGKSSWRESVYLKLFRSKRYTLMFLCDTMGFFAYMIVMQYLTDNMTNVGLKRSDATWCIAILGLANTFSKLVCGFLCNKKYLGTYSMYAWSHVLSGLTSCMIVFIDSPDPEILRYQCFFFSLVLGLTIGPYSLTPSVQADIVPLESMPSAMSAITIGEGIALMLGPFVAGLILDASGKNYNLLFTVGGISMLATGVLPLLIYLPFCGETHPGFE